MVLKWPWRLVRRRPWVEFDDQRSPTWPPPDKVVEVTAEYLDEETMERRRKVVLAVFRLQPGMFGVTMFTRRRFVCYACGTYENLPSVLAWRDYDSPDPWAGRPLGWPDE